MDLPSRKQYGPQKSHAQLSLTNKELSFLYQAGQELTSVLRMEQLDIVNFLLYELLVLQQSSMAFVWLVDQNTPNCVCKYGIDAQRNPRLRTPEASNVNLIDSVIHSGKSVTIPNNSADNSPGHAAMVVPIKSRDAIIGAIELLSDDRCTFTTRAVCFVEAFANTLATTIDNIKVSEHSIFLAEEQIRQRLAGKLHDAVNQSLFSAALIAEVLPRLWVKDVEEGKRSMQNLRLLIRGASAELRGILGELRPALLADTDLPTLLRQLGDAFFSKSHIPVVIEIEGSGSVPMVVHDTIYKICNEALINIGRHANANRVTIRLHYDLERVCLRIQDDGVGFLFSNIQPGKYGLELMRERSLELGAQLEIVSTPGQGTKLEWCWAASSNVESK